MNHIKNHPAPKTKSANNAADWQEAAYKLFEKYLMNCAYSKEFQCEDFRKWAYTQGLEQPANERSFGSLIIRAAKNNLIIKAGAAPVENRIAHAAIATVWRKT